MREALIGGIFGLIAGALSVASLWLITGFAAQAARGIRLGPPEERPNRWDASSDFVPEKAPTTRGRRKGYKGDGIDEADPPRLDDTDGEATRESGGSRALWSATFRILFAFLLKAPLLVAIALGAQSLGTVGLYWCVGGVMLVYFLAVIWAAGQTNL